MFHHLFYFITTLVVVVGGGAYALPDPSSCEALLTKILERLNALEEFSSDRRRLSDDISSFRDDNERLQRRLSEMDESFTRRQLAVDEIIELSHETRRKMLSIDEFMDAINSGVDYIKTKIDAVGDGIDSVGTSIENMASDFGDTLYENALSFQSSVTEMRDNVVDRFEDKAEEMREGITNVRQYATDQMNNVLKKSLTAATTLVYGLMAGIFLFLLGIIFIFWVRSRLLGGRRVKTKKTVEEKKPKSCCARMCDFLCLPVTFLLCITRCFTRCCKPRRPSGTKEEHQALNGRG